MKLTEEEQRFKRDAYAKQRQQYMKYKRAKRNQVPQERSKFSPLPKFNYVSTQFKIEPTKDNFKGTGEPRCCSVFGCGNRLTLQEYLFSNRCIHHQVKGKIDPTVFVSHPIKRIA